MLAPALALTLFIAAPQSKVWVVDGDGACPSADFAEIQAAVDAAADGDTILVLPRAELASYGSFFVDGKGLRVIGSTAPGQPRPIVRGVADVENLPAGSEFVMTGMDIRGPFSDFFPIQSIAPRVDLADCAGQIWIGQCRLDGTGISLQNGSLQQASLRVENCAAVVVNDCEVIGASHKDVFPGFPTSTQGGEGVFVVASELILHQTDVEGGKPGTAPTFVPGFPTVGPRGGHGVLLGAGAVVDLFGCSIEGGDGGQGSTDPLGAGSAPDGKGGDALRIEATDAFVLRVGTSLKGGVGQPNGANAPTGPGAGNVTVSTNPPRRLSAITPVASEGGVVVIGYDGAPDDLVFMAFGIESAFAPIPGFFGTGLVGLPAPIVALGTAGANGRLEASFPVPDGWLPPATAFGIPAQAGVINPIAAPALSSGTWVTLLDAALAGC